VQRWIKVNARKVIWEIAKVMAAAIIAAVVIEILHDQGIFQTDG
jgi:hypothetical protein